METTASPFIFNDAIISLAQSLTEALNQLASGLRRACDLIEQLGRRGLTPVRISHRQRTAYQLWHTTNKAHAVRPMRLMFNWRRRLACGGLSAWSLEISFGEPGSPIVRS